ncbi:MAG TPA: hypothetical protein VN622_08975 [Clostridia bacterium]|nr:hypothetical protein [Clostridia bacterium]
MSRSRRTRKSREEREWSRRMNTLKKASAALRGARTNRVSLNTDEVVTVVLALHQASLRSYLEREEACRLAQRIYGNKDSEWLKSLQRPRPSPCPMVR